MRNAEISHASPRNNIRKNPTSALAVTANCRKARCANSSARRNFRWSSRQPRTPNRSRARSTSRACRATETQLQALGFWAVQWLLPRELTFSRAVLEPRLNWLLETSHGWLRRMKGVFRTGMGPSWLIQASGAGLTGEDSAFRRDSRIEVVLSAAPTPQFLESWRAVLHDAANPPRQ